MNSKKGKLIQAAIALSVKIVSLHDDIERKAYLKNQLARAATSIGANIHEATYAESSDDFVHKLRVALKECHETEYWLIVLGECCPHLAEVSQKLRKEAGNIRYMLISSINTKLASMHTQGHSPKGSEILNLKPPCNSPCKLSSGVVE